MDDSYKDSHVFYSQALGGEMKKKDAGTIHKFYSLIVLFGTVLCFSVLLQVMKAGYVSGHLEDSLTQANLAAILIDPYHYGSTGELIFADKDDSREVFREILSKALGNEESRRKLGIAGAEQIQDFRLYEVNGEKIREYAYNQAGVCSQTEYTRSQVVNAPDGTEICNSSVYARIAVPIEFLFGVEITAIKEHCVDIVSEEIGYE